MTDPPPSQRRVAVLAVLWLTSPPICAGAIAQHLGMPFWVGVILAYYLSGFTAGCLVWLLEVGDEGRDRCPSDPDDPGGSR